MSLLDVTIGRISGSHWLLYVASWCLFGGVCGLQIHLLVWEQEPSVLDSQFWIVAAGIAATIHVFHIGLLQISFPTPIPFPFTKPHLLFVRYLILLHNSKTLPLFLILLTFYDLILYITSHTVTNYGLIFSKDKLLRAHLRTLFFDQLIGPKKTVEFISKFIGLRLSNECHHHVF